MLHPIKLPTYDQNLEHILQFQQQFITFLCNPDTPLCPKEEDFVSTFHPKTAQWFYKWLYRRNKSKVAYYQFLCDLLDHIHNTSNLSTEISAAFQHDIDFADHLTDVTFAFSFQNLDSKTQGLLKSLFVPFYDDIFCRGFPASIAAFNRKKLLKIFWDTNSHLKVCPACDGLGIEFSPDNIRCHLDHFFPKSLYPLFVVYAKNLVPICSICNSDYKSNKDPLVHTYPNPLIYTFHPFEKPALEELNVIITRGSKGEKTVCLEEKDGTRSKRIESLNYVFALETRWTGRLNNEIGNIRIRIENYARRHRREYANNRDIVEAVLRDMEDDADLLGKEHSYVLRHSYVQYALRDSDEFEELVGLLP